MILGEHPCALGESTFVRKNRLFRQKNAGIPETYKVTTGDTLSKIARKRYGDATKWREIDSANPGLNLKKLKAGQILYLPNLPAKGSLEKGQ